MKNRKLGTLEVSALGMGKLSKIKLQGARLSEGLLSMSEK